MNGAAGCWVGVGIPSNGEVVSNPLRLRRKVCQESGPAKDRAQAGNKVPTQGSDVSAYDTPQWSGMLVIPVFTKVLKTPYIFCENLIVHENSRFSGQIGQFIDVIKGPD